MIVTESAAQEQITSLIHTSNPILISRAEYHESTYFTALQM